jgi:hypothetical protein
MKIHIVYFAYLKPNEWEDIVLEQLWDLKSTKLYEMADSINMSVCCDDISLKRLKQHIWAKFKKVGIINRVENNQYEYPGLKAVWDIAQEDTEDSVILYFHTKGMTSEKKIGGVKELRKFLFENTILNFENYINEFNNHQNLDVGCIFPSEYGFSWYNFFWVRGSYVKNNIPKPEPQKNRYVWERYIGSEYSKKNVNCFSPFLGHNKLGNKAQLFQLKKRIMV